MLAQSLYNPLDLGAKTNEQAKENRDKRANGFSFDNFTRNAALLKAPGAVQPKLIKTGTTTVAVIYKDGCVLGADTRATAGNFIAMKKCFKIHYLQPNIYCLGAGTAGDLENVTLLMSGRLELHRLNTGKEVPIIAAVRMFKQMLYQYQGHVGAALIVGGVDSNGPYISSIAPHGSTMKTPFLSMGSGSIAAYAVLESRYKADMTKEQAMELVADAVYSGVHNDLYSGSNVDLCVIQKGEKTEVHRPYRSFQADYVPKEQSYVDMIRGRTQVLSEGVKEVEYDVLDIGVKIVPPRPAEDVEAMEIG